MKKSYQNQGVCKIKIHKRLVSLLLATSIGVGSYVLADPFHNKDYDNKHIAVNELSDNQIPIPKEEDMGIVEETISYPTVVSMLETSTEPVYSTDCRQGDSVVTTSNVNLRINSNTDSYIMGVLPQGTIVNRILSIGDWDLIRYKDVIAYVNSNYLQNSNVDYNDEYYKVEDYSDIIRTTTNVHFRLGPSISEKDICLLDKNEELTVIGKAVINFEPDNIWYLAKARGKIGFVKAEYTKSLRSVLEANVSGINDVKVQKLGYLISETPIYDANWNLSTYGDTFQLVQILTVEDSYCLAIIGREVGYIPKENIKLINGSFLVVDISDQIVSYYCNTDIVFQSVCTTGKKKTPTDKGFFEPYAKSSSHNFGPSHNNVESKILWMPFNGGEGFHDAPWEAAKNFGSYDYAMNHGSAGCVRLPDEAASFLYQNVPQSTKVLVKQ